MANFKDCVKKAVDAGLVDSDEASTLDSFDDPSEALAWARREAALKKYQTMLDAKAFADLKAEVYAHPRGPHVGLMSVLTKDKYGVAGNRNVEYMAAARMKRYFSEIPELISILRTRTWGITQDKQALDQVVRGLFGEEISDQVIKGQVQKLKDLFETIRLDFNARGGNVGKNELWHLPQHHDADRIKAMGSEQWKQDIKPMLDREAMTNDLGQKLSDEELDAALDYAYKSITTGGLNKIKGLGEKTITTARLGKKLANRHSEQRFIFFKDADSWMAYNAKYGAGDAYSVITGHIKTMANEIALMERFGSNPNQMFETFQAMLAMEEKQPNSKFMLDWTWNVVSGKIDQKAVPAIGRIAQTMRNVITASTLGSAAISSTFTDPWAAKITANFNGFSGTKVIKQYLKLLDPSNETDRKFAASMGFVVDSAIDSLAQTSRFADIEAHTFTGKLAEAVIRASGLSAMTDSLQTAFSLMFANHLGDNFGKSLSELPEGLRKSFKRYGITEAEWDAFRKTPLAEHNGASFADVTQEGGEKFHEMILSEQAYAVPAPDAFVRGVRTGGTSAGTLPGELWRAGTSLKGFPMSMIFTHLYRGIYQTSGWDKASYFGKLLVGGAVMGGLTLQLKDIAMGREPRPVDAKFIVASFAQSGGLGIFGDFIFADQNRFGSSIANTVVGPSGELLDKTMKLTLGNVQQLVAGEDTDFASELVDYGYRYSPKVWWTRPIQNAVQEQLQVLVDDSANDKFRRIIKARNKEYNQGFWWRPGAGTPEMLQ